jgi:cytoskeleton protein RodZ
MDELGHILREARETKGLTLNEVQEQTRINSRFLEALEMGDYIRLPTPVHVRGFLRNYARFLGLDPGPLLERYELGQQERPSQPQSILIDPTEPIGPALKTPPEDQPFFDPVNVEVDAGFRRRGSSEALLRLVIILGLIGLIFLAGQRFILPLITGDGDDAGALNEAIESAIQNITNQAEETAVPETTPEVGASSVLVPTGRNDPGTELEPTPTQPRPSLPATMEIIELKVEILERAWMEVTIDGDVVFSGIAKIDDTFEWTADEEAKILTGNAMGVFVTINDIELGRLGGRQENKEEVWRTTN